MISDQDLKPCPFCGGKAQFVKLGEAENEYDICCATFDCYLESGADWRLTKEELFQMWDRRKEPTAKVEA